MRWLPTGLIAHVQLNDPNRRAPGQGDDALRADPRRAEAQRLRRRRRVEPFDYVPDGAGLRRRALPATCAACAKRSPDI